MQKWIQNPSDLRKPLFAVLVYCTKLRNFITQNKLEMIVIFQSKEIAKTLSVAVTEAITLNTSDVRSTIGCYWGLGVNIKLWASPHPIASFNKKNYSNDGMTIFSGI